MTENRKYLITTGIAILSLLVSGYGIFLNKKTNDQIALDRINQVSLGKKYDRVFVGTEDISYKVDVTNGSDLNIYDVTIFAPEDIREMREGSITFDENGKPRGHAIGDMPPNSKETIDFLLINSQNAQLQEFKMKFKTIGNDSKEQWWIKEPGSVAKKTSKL